MFKIKFNLVVSLYLLQTVVSVEIENPGRRTSHSRDSRKLFGGYRITPRFCKPTRRLPTDLGGPNICMFNHECSQRNGQVVGACMDGFLFGACCQLPAGVVGELMESDLHSVSHPDNNLQYKPTSTTRAPPPSIQPTSSQITLNGVSQIAQTLLKDEVLPTAQENVVVQVGGVQGQFSTPGVTHPTALETFILNQDGNNEINPDEFKRPSSPATFIEDRKTTSRIEGTTAAYRPVSSPYIQISVSNGPDFYTPKPVLYERPNFRPKPSKPSNADKYVLIPTISHTAKPNRTEFDSIVNILQMLNDSSTTTPYASSNTYTYSLITTKKPPSTSYVFSLKPSQRPTTQTTVTRRPPSTSYVYSSTPVTSRATTKPLTTKKKPQKRPTTKPLKTTSLRPSSTSSLYLYPTTTTNSYVYSSTVRPAHSTFANSPSAFPTTSKKPPSTSYIYSSTFSKRPTLTANAVTPGYTVTSELPAFPGSSLYPSSTSTSNYASPPPTIIIFGPSTSSPIATSSPNTITQMPTKRKPVAHVTINNHVTHNLYSTENPSPTVIITPKPSLSSPRPGRPTTDYYTPQFEMETSVNDLINFPPVRNPNLNISATYDDEFTTPAFMEDDALNIKMESFVNKIVQSLQEPFQGLKDVVYNKNTTVFAESTTKKPTKKPAKSTSRPSSTNARPISSKRPTTRRPSTTFSSRRPTTSSKKTTPARRVTTTQSTYFETNLPTTSTDYRHLCGVRPLLKTGRIVGGKAAAFGEFPWQVLVREATWLGLFTKNKCGGVLVSNRFVMTAAHCQPGFLASLVVVLGEHDISGERESKRSLSRNVKNIIAHRKYDAATFENDLALLELEHPVQFDEHIVPICLPREGEDFTGRIATVTGWGRLKYGGGVPSILQEVQVPIMENQVCQEMFRTAGHSKVILDSFLCAGYANGQKDSCEGDSGGPLVLQRPDGRYQLAGTVSHGIKCAAPYLPGVYMRTSYYMPWIESVTGVHRR